MSSIAPSSTSSFRSTARAGRFSFPSSESSLSNLNSNKGSAIDGVEQDDEAEYEVTTKTTMRLVHSLCHGTTPCRSSPPPLRPGTPVSTPTVKRGETPSTPVSRRYVKKQPALSTPIKGQYFKKEPTPCSPPASPTKAAQQAYHSPAKDCPTTCSKDGIIRSSEELRLLVPCPEELPTPVPTVPAIKNWYVVTVGQEVSIFDSWLDVLAHIRGVPDPAHISHPTYAQAYAKYSKQYHAGDVEIVLLLGSKWAQAAVAYFEDKFSDFEYSAEDEAAVHQVEVYAEAERAYQNVLKAHGFA